MGKPGNDKWGQHSGGWSPFAAPAKNGKTICGTCDGARTYEALNTATGKWFTRTCNDC